ncbi:MAG: hypothetical protein A6F72_05375 [Cycloclasticus sp. symbiont of Poecilosclerida sp. N]|nr:MAG: hypothetical protein A6F72_05375 [Cycloclasticus sp. symbiont of Poecilosclerida sp. N]
MKEFIAYQGNALTVEWFFDENGNSDSLDYFESLSDAQKRKTLMLFRRMGDFGKNHKNYQKRKKFSTTANE